MKNQVTFFLPTYSLLTPKSAHTSERVKEYSVRSQGLKASLCLFQTIAVFIITKNVLDEV